MILRIDDTDVERNTQESLDSIFDGLKWLDLSWDEFYRQSERGELHRKMAEAILAQGARVSRLHAGRRPDDEEKSHAGGPWLFNPGDARAVARGKRPPCGGRRAVRAALPRAARIAHAT